LICAKKVNKTNHHGLWIFEIIYLFILFVQVNIYWWPPSLGAHLVADQNLILMEKKYFEN